MLFTTNAPFWEQYYARLHAMNLHRKDLGQLMSLSGPDAQLFVRHLFPQFYTLLDVLYYSSGQNGTVYMLVKASLQDYAKAVLLRLSHPELAQQSFERAMKILGPVNAPGYRQILGEKLSSDHKRA